MVQLSRLRLVGFKSFVEKTELDIGNGLSGIVGPNGCGKSNLVEALRWVMGETRAKHMRSDGMEDVIFAGTSQRPARNIAEVSLLLDNSDGTAPLPFTNSAQIEVTRRIERGKGSKYLVNGKEVRARDVHMLFADSMTGAHSPALVSQGRVTQLIAAKPAERRQMLEESAGVAALYTRRKEAESRLNAAEENLGKLDLVIGEMQNRANALRNQAKQALKYTDLSDTIRRLDMVLAWQNWVGTRERMRREEMKFADTDKGVSEAMLKISKLTRAVEEAVTESEDSRKADIETRAGLQLLKQSHETLAREIAHRADEYADLQTQIAQNTADAQGAGEQQDAQAERVAAIKAELAEIAAAHADEGDVVGALEAQFADAGVAQRTAEDGVLVLQDNIRRAKSERDMASRDADRAEGDVLRAQNTLAQLQAEFDALQVPTDDEAKLDAARTGLEKSRTAKDAMDGQITAAQDLVDSTRAAYQAAQDAQNAADQALSQAQREAKSLSDLLVRLSAGHEDSVLLALDVPAELAPALARAAGELASGAGETGDCYWAGSEVGFAAGDWPTGVLSFDSLVKAPTHLRSFLSSIGLTDDAAAHVGQLKAGQILVNRAGDIWRWDGLVAKADAGESREAQILSLRQQVKDAQGLVDELAPKAEECRGAVSPARISRDDAQMQLTMLQTQLRSLNGDVQRFEGDVRRLEDVVAARVVKRDVCQGRLVDAQGRVQTADEAYKAAKASFDALNGAFDAEASASQLQDAEESLATARAVRDAASAKLESAKAASAQAAQLQHNLSRELERTQAQIERAVVQMQTLNERLASLNTRHDALKPLIDADAQGTAQQALLSKIEEADALARRTSDAFAVFDNKVKTLQFELKDAEAANITMREKRAVIQATVQALQEDQGRIAEEIQERFGVSPSHLENTVMVQWPEGVPALHKAREERDYLNREREAMGPVNLRAQVELEEIEAHFTQLETEKAELAEAISRLREGITLLNTEARARITKTFAEVSEHFQVLFKQLFGGGEAQLKMVDSDDPLDAGLEIYAQPPGKSLQSLTLLSGGEQTLTALAMIFAMFLSNPAPVCVLDEVDAPLDDANVDRVCSMLESMASRCATRFLVITHHRMTMARMERLYGVTMAERGVSKLVSVNLALQSELLAGAGTQAA